MGCDVNLFDHLHNWSLRGWYYNDVKSEIGINYFYTGNFQEVLMKYSESSLSLIFSETKEIKLF